MPRIYKSDSDKLKVYKTRVKDGLEVAKTRETDVKEMVDRYELEHEVEHAEDEAGNFVTITSGIGIIDSMYSSLTAVEVGTILRNKGHGTIKARRVAEQALTEELAELRVGRKTARAVKEALISDISWLKVHYEYDEVDEDVARSDEDIDTDVQGVFDEAKRLGVQPGDSKWPTPDLISKVIPTHETKPVVKRDRIILDQLDWNEVIFDPYARKWDRVLWVCQVTKELPEDIHTNPRFIEYAGKKKVESIKPDATLKLVDPNREGVDDDRRCTLYEMWDLENGTVCWFTEGTDFLLDEQPSYLFNEPERQDRSPFVPVIMRESLKSPYGIGDMRLISPSLDQQARLKSNLLNYSDQFNPKVMMPEGALTEEGKEAYASNEYGRIVEYDGNKFSTAQFKDLLPPTMPQEMFGLAEREEQAMRDATGVNELMRGLFPDRKRTATETAEVIAASSARQSEKRNLLEEVYVGVARRVLKLMQMNYDSERITRLAEVDGDFVWEWDAETVTMETDLRIFLEPKVDETRQDRMDRAQWMIANLGALPPDVVDHRKLVEHAALDFGVPMQVLREILKTEDEAQVQKQQELQDQANAAEASAGVIPDATNVPGPLGADDLVAAANPGDMPADLDPRVEQAIDMDTSNSPLDVMLGP